MTESTAKSPTLVPTIVSGPCAAESLELMVEVADFMSNLGKRLGFNYVFKSSFDKANRTSIKSYRGPGMGQGLAWMSEISERFNVPVLTDIHETHQAQAVAEVCDVLQIPAFLCRQTDLIEAALKTGRNVHVKKGQFLAPESCKHIVSKAEEIAKDLGRSDLKLTLTERGTCFGYGNLVVDMRSFQILKSFGVPVIFDLTHSLQMPSSGQTTLGQREYAGSLARAAAATGFTDGFFMEVHPKPAQAKSDSETQLDFSLAEKLLTQILPIWHQARNLLS